MHKTSPNQQRYLKTLKRQKQSVIFARVLLFAAFFLLWETASGLG